LKDGAPDTTEAALRDAVERVLGSEALRYL